jgi:beta-lactamase class D
VSALLSFIAALLLSPGLSSAAVESARAPPEISFARRSCFLLYEIGAGQRRREPDAACNLRVTPGSTFMIAHALFALDAGVVATPDESIAYDGAADVPESSRRDHTLASSLRHSVIWYHRRLAERLGAAREQAYLLNVGYGNMDASGDLTRFWSGNTLLVSPDEQQTFLLRLYNDKLPLSATAQAQVRAMLVQPEGNVVNSRGTHGFVGAWPTDAVVSAKTAATTDATGHGVRWIVGHVERGARAFVFVACVVGPETVGPNAAIDLAAKELRDAGVL